MGWQEVFGLNKAIQNRSIIKDHLIFKDQQYQKHKVEFKKIVLYKSDLTKAVHSCSLPQQLSMKVKNERWGKQAQAARRARGASAQSLWGSRSHCSSDGTRCGGPFFFSLLGRKKKKKKTAKETSTKSCNCPLPKTTAL